MTKEQKIKDTIRLYEHLVLGIEEKAKSDMSERAYGGIVRAGKGELVESIAKELVKTAWEDLGQENNRLKIDRKKIKIPIKRAYIERIKSPKLRRYIYENIDKHYYLLSADLHIFIDNKFVLVIECKSYTENAMLKRILVDFTLLKQVYKNLNFVLLQLESQLGGDYSKLSKSQFGGPSSHTLLSYFDVDLYIITLISGERKVDRPIHKKKYYKPLTKEGLHNAMQTLKKLLSKYRK